MKYNRFFNIHIPKTGGTFFRENMLKPLEYEMHKNNIETNPFSGGGDGDTSETMPFHLCWYEPFITDKTYIYTSLRDPASRIVSHYAWQALRAINYKKTNYTYSDINKNNFYKWFEKYENINSNYQSKNLTYYNKNIEIYKESVHRGWNDNDVPTIESYLFSNEFNFQVNKIKLHDNVQRINLLVRSEDLLHSSYQNKVINKIAKNLEIDCSNILFPKDKYGHENPISKDLFKTFTKKELNNFYEHSKLDSEIYFSNQYTII